MEHDLKCWPEFFAVILSGDKTFELRKDDRFYSSGDTLLLREYDPKTLSYSGREIKKYVPHLLRHKPGAGCAAEFGLSPGYVILSLSDI
jgi:hypothetical protein